MTQINSMVLSLTQNQTSCSVRSSGPFFFGSTTTNGANGSDEIPAELFKILKDDAVNVLHSICQQIWKTQQWPQLEKFSFHSNSQRKATSKAIQTAVQFFSFQC